MEVEVSLAGGGSVEGISMSFSGTRSRVVGMGPLLSFGFDAVVKALEDVSA